MHRIAVAVTGLVALASSAEAQSKTTSYQVSFEKVANSCQNTGMSLSNAKVELATSGKKLSVTIPMIPLMKGLTGKAGKFKAQAKRGKTAIDGLDGKFRIAGKTEGRSIELVLVAEYYKGATPLCTQSWKGQGNVGSSQSSSGPSRSLKSSTSSSP